MAQASAAFKGLCVGMLVLQNSALCLTMRYSRAVLKESYLTSTTIVLNELVKLLISCTMILLGYRITRAIRLKDLPRHIYSIMFCREALLMSVPGFLYFVMNQLAFVGLENLEASTYSLVSQLKILTTALFARLILSKQLQWFQWRALLLLVIGVVLVQQQPAKSAVAVVGPPAAVVGPGGMASVETFVLPQSGVVGEIASSPLSIHASQGEQQTSATSFALSPASPSESSPTERHLLSSSTTTPVRTSLGQTAGLFATLLAAVLSGLAGCYVEKMMKGGTLSVWDRNVQLAIYGSLFGLAQIVLFSSPADRAYAKENGWLGGYSFLAMIVVLLNSLGGILVSLVVVYLDNIIRGFATSVAILLTAFVSYVAFHDVELSTVFVCGVVTVLISVANYQDSMQAPPVAVVPAIQAAPRVAQEQVQLGAMPSASSARLLHALGGDEEQSLSSVSVHRFGSSAEDDNEQAALLARSSGGATVAANSR